MTTTLKKRNVFKNWPKYSLNKFYFNVDTVSSAGVKYREQHWQARDRQ